MAQRGVQLLASKTGDILMVPCKFQLDATGTAILIYSKDRKTVHMEAEEGEIADDIAATLGLEPLGRAFAFAHQMPNGNILIGEGCSEEDFNDTC